MGVSVMSERALQRIGVLSKIVEGRMTIVAPSSVLSVST
jgi:hypothetical protein